MNTGQNVRSIVPFQIAFLISSSVIFSSFKYLSAIVSSSSARALISSYHFSSTNSSISFGISSSQTFSPLSPSKYKAFIQMISIIPLRAFSRPMLTYTAAQFKSSLDLICSIAVQGLAPILSSLLM